MALQQSFGQDDQGKQNPRNELSLAPSGGTGVRTAAFVGGDIDPVTGNLVPGSKTSAARGSVVTGSEVPPPPEPEPTPQVVAAPSALNQVTAEAPPPPAAPQAAAPAAAPAFARDDKSNVAEQVGKWFCYGKGTLILLEDGQWLPVEDLQIGNLTALGGMVTATGRTAAAFLYEYAGQSVSGSHAVFEDGKFVRVEDSGYRSAATHLHADGVYPIATENHLLVTPTHIAADFSECEGGQNMTPIQRLSVLNREHERLAWLSKQAKECFSDAKA